MSAILAIFGSFRKESSDHSQTLPENRGSYSHEKSRKKIGNIYGHLAKIAIWNRKNCQNFNLMDIWHLWPKWTFISGWNCLETIFSKLNWPEKAIAKEFRALEGHRKKLWSKNKKISIFFEKIYIFGKNRRFFSLKLPSNNSS